MVRAFVDKNPADNIWQNDEPTTIAGPYTISSGTVRSDVNITINADSGGTLGGPPQNIVLRDDSGQSSQTLGVWCAVTQS